MSIKAEIWISWGEDIENRPNAWGSCGKPGREDGIWAESGMKSEKEEEQLISNRGTVWKAKPQSRKSDLGKTTCLPAGCIGP